jgi:hypothetical protein
MMDDDERFTSDDELRVLTESIKVKRSLVLNTESLVTSEDEFFERKRDWVEFGGLEWISGQPIPGNLWPGFFSDDDVSLEAKLREQLKVQSDAAGTTTAELTYYPVVPTSREEAEVLFEATSIGEHLTFDEFIEDMDNGADWIYDVFATATICFS